MLDVHYIDSLSHSQSLIHTCRKMKQKQNKTKSKGTHSEKKEKSWKEMIYKENENRNQQRHIIPNNDNKDEKKIEMSLGYDMTELLSTFSVLPLSSLSGWFVMLISSFSRQLRIQPQSKENKIKLNSKLCVQCTWILSQKCSSLEFACNSHLSPAYDNFFEFACKEKISLNLREIMILHFVF